eukprot:gene3189-1840_t
MGIYHPLPLGKKIASLHIGYSVSGFLQTDGTVLMQVQKDMTKDYEMYPSKGEGGTERRGDGEPGRGTPPLESRSDVLAVTPGNGMLFIIADPAKARIVHPLGAGCARPARAAVRERAARRRRSPAQRRPEPRRGAESAPHPRGAGGGAGRDPPSWWPGTPPPPPPPAPPTPAPPP